MSQPKRQHYLPRFYLEKFSKNAMLHVFDRVNKEYRLQPAINTALQNRYYTITEKDGSKYNGIEKLLSIIEGCTKPVLDKIDNRTKLSMEEKEILATFISFLKVRTPDYEKLVNETTEKGMKKINKITHSSEGKTAALIKEYEASTGDKLGLSAKEVYDFIQGDRYQLEYPREYSLGMMVKHGFKMVPFLLNLDWFFLQATDKASFVTSDTPFVIMPPKDFKHGGFYGVGIVTPGAKKIIPLSPKSCLMLGDFGQKMMIGTISRENVRKINIAMTANCDRIVIARDQPLLQRLVKLTKIGEWKIKSRINFQ